jgi:hypothetical protein
MKSLRGPFPLTHDALASEVAARFGVFALGYTAADGRFCTNAVGRADGNLRERLACHIGLEREFKFLPLPSTTETFEAECRLFHSLMPLKTRAHPARSPGMGVTCPICGNSRTAHAISNATDGYRAAWIKHPGS